MENIISRIQNANNDFVDNPAEYKLIIRKFANKTVDYVVHKIKHRIPKLHKEFNNKTLSYSSKSPDEKREDNLLRAIRRAKQQVHFAVRSIGADHMLTLHTRQNIQDRQKFFLYFARFIQLVRTKKLVNGRLLDIQSKRHYPFCAVPELQERGAYHMHVAVSGKQDIPFLRACWYVALGGTEFDKNEQVLGNIDVTTQTKRFSNSTTTLKTRALVGYLTKYITKSFQEDSELGIHRYTKSRGNPPVDTKREYLMACFSNGEKGFLDAIKEVIDIAEVQGIGNDWSIWNRNDELFIIRGNIK
jgi:hypothetical protein